MEKTVPEGCLHMRPFQFHLKEHWRYPQSLDSLLPWTEAIASHLDWWQNPSKVMKGADLHPKTTVSNSLQTPQRRLGRSLSSGLWSDQEKRLHINVLELKAVSLAFRSFKDQCQNQTALVAMDNSTVVAYLNKQGGTHSAEMCALLWNIMTWCHHYHIKLKARHIPGCLNVMADILSRSNQGHSTEWPLICHSSEPQPSTVRISCPRPNAWDIDGLNINWTALTAYVYPPTALLHRVIQNQAMLLPDHRNSPRLARDALVLGPSVALNRDPTATPGVNNFSLTVPQSSQPPCLVFRSGQLQEQGFSVKVAERIAAPQRSSTRTIYKSKWTLFQKWSIKNLVDFSTPSVKQISDFFHVPVPRSKQAPLDHCWLQDGHC